MFSLKVNDEIQKELHIYLKFRRGFDTVWNDVLISQPRNFILEETT